MKNYIIILLCLSLLLCGCQAAGNNTGTEPTVAPTVAPTVVPTDEPTQEPTVAPTEPPLPAGPIRTETRWVTSADRWTGEPNWRKEIKPLHSVEEIKECVDTVLPDMIYEYEGSEIDYSRYDDTFFETNSVVVLFMHYIENGTWGFKVTDFTRDANGEYSLYCDFHDGSHAAWWSFDIAVFFVDLIGVTDDARVHLYNGEVDWVWLETEGAIWEINGILADVCVTPAE